MPSDEAEQALAMADEAFGRFDVDGMVAHLSTAIRALTAAGDPCGAAMACVRLGGVYANALGNLTAARAWFARAWRLVEDEPPCLAQGWVAVAALGCDVDDPERLLASAELALDRARRFGDVNLETKALADAGLAHVEQGRLAQGMALLDEAMALACGPADDSDATGKSVCSFFTACYYAADFGRAASWSDLFRRHGLIGTAPGSQVFLASHCDSVHATLLMELGRWGEAEAVLLQAKSAFESVMQLPSWHPDIALADLRVRQGRLAEAEALLLGKEQAMQALIPAARLHLDRGDHHLARAVARRGLRVVGNDQLRAVELLAILVEIELAAGDLPTARLLSTTLTQRAADLDVPALRARAASARSSEQAASGDLAGAVATIEGAVDGLDAHQLPWLRTMLLLDLAHLRDRSGDRAGATLDARTAAMAMAALDVVPRAGDTALLARLGVTGVAASRAELGRDGKWWVVSWVGTTVRLADTKGLRYLAELIRHPGVERHVLDLVDRIEGVDVDGGIDRRLLGDAGAAMDTKARVACRRRIEELRSEAEDALASGHLDRVEELQEELDAVVGHLAKAFGLGGRDRTAASAAERARLNVTRALRAAIGKLSEALPGAGEALDRRVRTGTYCAYEPDDEVRWIVQSELNGRSVS